MKKEEYSVEVLVSTTRKKNIKELNLTEKNLIKNVSILNQISKETKSENTKDIVMHHSKSKGLSKSRNFLLKHAKSDVLIITDDDTSFKENYKEIVRRAYASFPDADIISFNYQKGKDIIGFKKSRKLKFLDMFRISSVQMTMKKESVERYNLKFDERFALGSGIFNQGEETVFLSEAYKKKLKIYHFAEVILTHPDEQTTGEIWTENAVETKGAVGYLSLKSFSFIYFIYLFIFKMKEYKNSMTKLEFIKYYLKGKSKIKDLEKEKK